MGCESRILNRPVWSGFLLPAERRVSSIGYIVSARALNDPDGFVAATTYKFSPVQVQADTGFARREGVMVIPGADGVVDTYHGGAAPIEKREWGQAFRVLFPRGGGFDAARDLLLANVAPGYTQTLVYQTDGGALRYTEGSFLKFAHIMTVKDWLYADFGVTWRIRPNWQLRFSETAQVFGSTSTFHPAHDETFSARGYVPLNATLKTWTVNATGTLAVDLPTLHDTGPLIVVTGPFGGDSGMQITNNSALAQDPYGLMQPVTLTVPLKLAAGDTLRIDCASQTFTLNNRPVRPTKPAWQREWFRVQAGVANLLGAACLGANQVSGGGLTFDWHRNFA